jgi:hypothetical protein
LNISVNTSEVSARVTVPHTIHIQVSPLSASAAAVDITNHHHHHNPLHYQVRQAMEGFGGCFNEKGWDALLTLNQTARDSVMRALFDPNNGLG